MQKTSAYGKTVIAEYPSTRQVKNSPDRVSKSENHHPAIIDKSLFDRVQELRQLRTNGRRMRGETESVKVLTTAFVPRFSEDPGRIV
jgi:hypothetical protein